MHVNNGIFDNKITLRFFPGQYLSYTALLHPHVFLYIHNNVLLIKRLILTIAMYLLMFVMYNAGRLRHLPTLPEVPGVSRFRL